MKKICLFLEGFEFNGGIGRVSSILSNYLCNQDYEIHIISYFQESNKLLYNIDKKVKSHILFDTKISMTKAIFKKKIISKIRKILKNENIDYLIACGALYFPASVFASLNTNTKCYCWEHSNPLILSDYKFEYFCRLIASVFSNKIIVLTNSAKNAYIEKYKVNSKKIFQIFNPTSSNVISKREYNSASKFIISVGRLSYAKNFDRLIDIANEVFKIHPDWAWHIYGDGELKYELQEKINCFALNGKIKLMGQVSNIEDVYKNYSFLVMTSRYEGFPMVLIEGASNGLPLISFDIVSGPSDIIIDGENGFLVDCSSDQQMIDKICYLIDNVDLREKMSEKNYNIIENFNIDKVAKKWMQLFED